MIISNSTPLINFAAIRRLDILEHLFGKLVIPKAVERELLEKGSDYPSALAIQEAAFIDIVEIRDISLCESLKSELNDGEAEAITLALEHNITWLLLDEIKGRQTAKSYHIPVTGSIGCLVEAKRAHIIPAIKPLLDAMQTQARFWVHVRLYHSILQENGEL